MYCQKCRTPLRLDGSLEQLNPSSFKILVESAPSLQPLPPQPPRSTAAKERKEVYDQAAKHATSPQHKRTIPPPNKTTLNPAMSYVMLSESQIGPLPHDESQSESKQKPDADKNGITTNASAQQMETSLRLFEILSARSDIDHPVCSECVDLLLAGLQQRQATVNREKDAYVEFLKQAKEGIPTDEEQRQATEALKAAKDDERTALQELEALEAEKAAMEDEIAALDREEAELEEEEEHFWRERNSFDATLQSYREERDSLQNQLVYESKILESLQRTNVYNDSFCIDHDGPFATINGLRLGKLPDHSVDWPEINAAWGLCVLLLSVVSEKLAFAFQGYRLVPLGSTSKIEKLEYPQGDPSQTVKPKVTQFDLYCHSDLPLGLGFLHRGFDNAMVAFLDCVRQLGEHIERSTAQTTSTGAYVLGRKMPYKVVKDKVGDVSIKLGAFNQEEQWTKACKYTLTCCKFLLAHASHVDDISQDGHAAR